MEAPAPVAECAPADAVVATGKPKKAASTKVERIERNGVKRPGPGKYLEVSDRRAPAVHAGGRRFDSGYPTINSIVSKCVKSKIAHHHANKLNLTNQT